MHGNKCTDAHYERNFPQAKLDSEINAHFLLNEHGNLYFYIERGLVVFVLIGCSLALSEIYI